MPVYKYFGHPARFHGKPLMHLLTNLKEFGRGRIISRTSWDVDVTSGPSFYRVLWAQPLMDKETVEGRVVAEMVRKGVRYQEPVDLANIAPVPDFKLVARDQESEFCQWEKLRDFSTDVDFVTEPKNFTLPPLLKLLMERNLSERGESGNESGNSFFLPHYKTYTVKDKEVIKLPGEEKERIVKHQETVTKCEGVASYQYRDLDVETNYRDILSQLPDEPPYPQPAVGMRLYKIPVSDKFEKFKEEIRTDEHNTFFP